MQFSLIQFCEDKEALKMAHIVLKIFWSNLTNITLIFPGKIVPEPGIEPRIPCILGRRETIQIKVPVWNARGSEFDTQFSLTLFLLKGFPYSYYMFNSTSLSWCYSEKHEDGQNINIWLRSRACRPVTSSIRKW